MSDAQNKENSNTNILQTNELFDNTSLELKKPHPGFDRDWETYASSLL